MVKAATVVAFAAMLLAGRTDIVFAQTAKPQRIVSINLCLDELALRLADPGVVVSVTWLSQDPRIADFVEEARKHPANSGAAEDVLDYRPDLVLAGDFMPKNTQDLLNHVGATVRRFEIPSTSAQARKLILEVGDAVGEPARAASLVQGLDARLAAVSLPADAPRLKAIVFEPNGFTVGPGSLVDELLTRAGLDNLAGHQDGETYQHMPLERVVTLGADVLIIDGEDRTSPSLATNLLEHPLIRSLGGRLRVVAVPARLWTCGGPGIAEAVKLLVEATADLRPAAAKHG